MSFHRDSGLLPSTRTLPSRLPQERPPKTRPLAVRSLGDDGLCCPPELLLVNQAAAGIAFPAAAPAAGASAAAAAFPALLRLACHCARRHAAAAAQLAGGDCGHRWAAALCRTPCRSNHVSCGTHLAGIAFLLHHAVVASALAWPLDTTHKPVSARSPPDFCCCPHGVQRAGHQCCHAHHAAAPVALERRARGGHPGGLGIRSNCMALPHGKPLLNRLMLPLWCQIDAWLLFNIACTPKTQSAGGQPPRRHAG